MFYFKKVDKDGVVISVESKSVEVPSPGFILATRQQAEDFIAELSAKPPVIEVNWKALYANAKTASDKCDVLAERLGLKQQPTFQE